MSEYKDGVLIKNLLKQPINDNKVISSKLFKFIENYSPYINYYLNKLTLEELG